jgi:hypothetical protein
MSDGAGHFITHGEFDRYSWLMHPFTDREKTTLILARCALYALFLLCSVAGLPLFGATVWLLPALGDFFVNGLATNAMPTHPRAYHSAPMMPCLIVAAMIAQQRMKTRHMLLAAALLNLLLWLQNSNHVQHLFQVREPFRMQMDEEVPQIQAMIPADASLSAQNNINAYFARRTHLYRFPERSEGADYIVLHLSYPYRDTYTQFFGSPFAIKDYIVKVDALLSSSAYGVIYHANRYALLQKHAPDALDRNALIRELNDLR